MLYELLRHIRNLFARETFYRTFVIKDGFVELPIQEGQYYLIDGSVFNDGVHQYPSTDLKDEVFKGSITALAIPQAVIDLSKEIEEYKAQYPFTPYNSESFGGYSYTKGSGTSQGNAVTWQDAFKDKINAWRKI